MYNNIVLFLILRKINWWWCWQVTIYTIKHLLSHECGTSCYSLWYTNGYGPRVQGVVVRQIRRR